MIHTIWGAGPACFEGNRPDVPQRACRTPRGAARLLGAASQAVFVGNDLSMTPSITQGNGGFLARLDGEAKTCATVRVGFGQHGVTTDQATAFVWHKGL